MYLMIGFPGEKEGDLAIIKQIIRPFELAGIDLNLSIAPFSPKPHTPFQWLPMEDGSVLREKMSMIKALLKKKGAKVNYRDVTTSMIEGIISRGDEKLASLFEYLVERGVNLEAWREFFNPDLYYEWFSGNGLDMQEYLTGREMNKPLPWDFVDTGVGRSFLMNEMGKAEHGEMTVDCYSGCAACGIGCSSELRGQKSEVESRKSEVGIEKPSVSSLPSSIPQVIDPIPELPSPVCEPSTRKFTLRYGKYGDARYLGHIDTMDILLRAIRASGVAIKMHGKYHPMPNIALSDALPVGIESTCELIEIETDGGIVLGDRILEDMNRMLPKSMKIHEIIEGRLKDMVKEYAYVLVSDAGEEIEELKLWRRSGNNSFYLWKGKGIKLLWKKDIFKRIIKVEDKRVYGL